MTYNHWQYRQYPTAAGLRDSRGCGVRVSVCSAYRFVSETIRF